jgi:hypothetical protein
MIGRSGKPLRPENKQTTEREQRQHCHNERETVIEQENRDLE